MISIFLERDWQFPGTELGVPSQNSGGMGREWVSTWQEGTGVGFKLHKKAELGGSGFRHGGSRTDHPAPCRALVATVKHVMQKARDTVSHLNPDQVLVITADQQIYALCKTGAVAVARWIWGRQVPCHVWGSLYWNAFTWVHMDLCLRTVAGLVP